MVEVTDTRVDTIAVNRKAFRYLKVLAGYYIVATIVASFFPASIQALHAITAVLLVLCAMPTLEALDVWLQGYTTMHRFKMMLLSVGILIVAAAMHVGLMFLMSSWGQLLLLPELAIFIVVIFVLGLTGD